MIGLAADHQRAGLGARGGLVRDIGVGGGVVAIEAELERQDGGEKSAPHRHDAWVAIAMDEEGEEESAARNHLTRLSQLSRKIGYFSLSMAREAA